jgi:hypothetical protein
MSHLKQAIARPISTVLPCLLLLLIAQNLFAQSSVDKTRNDYFNWRSRVTNLSDEVVSDSLFVPDAERSLYIALLAKFWWKADPPRARDYLNRSSDLLLAELHRRPKPGDLTKNLRYALKTLRVMVSLDEKATQQVVGKLEGTLIANNGGQEFEDPELADLYAELGVQAVGTNPGFAAAAGFDSLIYGTSRFLPELISALYDRAPRLGASLYNAAVTRSRNNYSNSNFVFVGALGDYTFDRGSFSDQLRTSYLRLVGDLVSGAVAIDAERPAKCGIAFAAAPFASKFDQYDPGDAPTFRRQIQICIPFTDGLTLESTRFDVGGEELTTAADLVQRARNTGDQGLKVQLYRRAIHKLETQGKFVEIIDLLDDLRSDERRMFGYTWDELRTEYAFRAAAAFYGQRDMGAVNDVLNKTPKSLRPFARIRLVAELRGTKDNDFLLENAEAARRELGSFDVSPKDAAVSLLLLTKIYLEIQPNEFPALFRDAATYINKADNENLDFDFVKDWGSGADYYPLDSKMLELDEVTTANSISNVGSKRSRVRLKLGLLESSVPKYADAKKKFDGLATFTEP